MKRRFYPGRYPTEEQLLESLYKRLDCFTRQDPLTGCLIWSGASDKLGYGRIHSRQTSFLVHRVSYERHRGSIPAGLELDHLCRNPSCVNPDHLEAVTHRVNCQRGNAGLHMLEKPRPLQTHCKYGHPFSSENTIIVTVSGCKLKRRCRICINRREKKYRNKLRAQIEEVKARALQNIAAESVDGSEVPIQSTTVD